jgi:hypothetical protein
MQDNSQVGFGLLHTQGDRVQRDDMSSQLSFSPLFKADSRSLTPSGHVYNALIGHDSTIPMGVIGYGREQPRRHCRCHGINFACILPVSMVTCPVGRKSRGDLEGGHRGVGGRSCAARAVVFTG